jgi:hypothetical protein
LQPNIISAIKYIISHIQDQKFFVENPAFCGADEFALKVTYWKDSILFDRKDGKPSYPICYTLAQAQNLAGLRAGLKLLTLEEIQDLNLNQNVQYLFDGLQLLFNDQLNNFVIAQDKLGQIIADSDDFLHMLYYLEIGDLTTKQLEAILMHSQILETPFGYRTNSADFCSLVDSYHSCTLWPFEQAVIHAGAQKFNLQEVMEISSRVVKYLDTNPELFLLHGTEDGYKKIGNDPQLWTWACKKYFENLTK